VARTALVERSTKESQVSVSLDLDGTGVNEISTGVPFYDHMLAQLSKHGGIDLTVKTVGDLEIDAHHTVEDTAIALGQALREALGDKVGIRRFADAFVPLDEALAHAVVDVSGRPYLVHDEPPLVELPARPRAGWPQCAPHRRGAVQSGGPRVAGRGIARPALGRRAVDQRRPVIR
jgi:imidazoleglycerol-phosphate dehydratase